MNAVVFDGLPGLYRLGRAVVLATPGRLDAVHAVATATAVTEVSQRKLRGRLDPASLLAELAATELAAVQPSAAEPARRGVFLASRRGNQESVRRFSGELASGRRSPATFSGAGYNIVAQSAARALPAHGPSVVLAGRRASLDGALFLAALRLRSGAVDTAYTGLVGWVPGEGGPAGGEGLCVLTTLTRAAALPEAEEPHRIDPSAAFEATRAGARPLGELGPEEVAALRRIDAAAGAPVLVGAA